MFLRFTYITVADRVSVYVETRSLIMVAHNRGLNCSDFRLTILTHCDAIVTVQGTTVYTGIILYKVLAV